MKELENIPEALFELLQNKSFQELDPKEKELALEYLKEEEYEEYRLVVNEFQSVNAEVYFDKEMPDFSNSEIISTEKRKFPFYRMAAGFSILILAGLTIWDLYPEKQVDPDPVIPQIAVEENIGIDPAVIEMQFQTMHQTVEVSNENPGTSLANEDYPEDLVFEFGAGVMPGEGLRSHF